MRYLIATCCLCLIGLAPGVVAADAPESVESALSGYFSGRSEDPAAQTLETNGFEFDRLLIAETLPSGQSVMVEAELRRDDVRLRYPVKLKRESSDEEAGWRIDWAPGQAYARALVALEGARSLAEIDGERWSGLERLPALPIVVRSGALVTPFGEVAESPSDRRKDAEQVAPPEQLGEHIESWVGLVLEDAPGPAAVDLIIESDVSWRQVTRAMMGPASLGLFRVYLVGADDDLLTAQSAVAPVLGEHDENVALVVGMYDDDQGDAYRVRIGGELIEGSQGCDDEVEATFCADTNEAFREGIDRMVLPALEETDKNIAMITFGATGQVPAGRLAARRLALAEMLGVPAAKTFVGFIDDAKKAEATDGDQNKEEGEDDAR